MMTRLRLNDGYKSLLLSSFVFVLSFLLSACVEQVILDPQLKEMPIVVNCVLTESDTQYLELYYSKRSSEGSYKVIDNADVSISGGGVTCHFVWNGDCYEALLHPKHGLAYRLTVILPGGKGLSANTTFPPDVYVDCISLSGDDHEGNHDRSPANYYILRTNLRADHKYSDEAYMWILPEMIKYEAIPWEGVPYMYDYVAVDTVRLSYICTDHGGADDFNISRFSWDSMADVGNMDRYYSASPDSWERYKRICSRLPMHESFLRIHQPKNYEGLTVGGESGYFILSSDASFGKYPDYVPHFKTSILSREYDAYLRNIANNAIIYKDDFSKIYSQEEHYTNIDGGLGVFGAKYDL